MIAEKYYIKNIKNLDRHEIIAIIQKYKRNGIHSLFIWTMMQYQLSVSLYRVKKDEKLSETEAFIFLWLSSDIDYDGKYELNNGIDPENAEGIYDYELKKYIDGINFVNRKPSFFSEYVKGRVEQHVEFVKRLRSKYPINWSNQTVAKSIRNVIFQDYEVVHENEFKLEKIVSTGGLELLEDNSSGPMYRDLFFESTDEYFYFTG